jgi:hypothetical protein
METAELTQKKTSSFEIPCSLYDIHFLGETSVQVSVYSPSPSLRVAASCGRRGRRPSLCPRVSASAPTWKGLPLPYSTFRITHSALRTPHSSFLIPHSRLSPASRVSWSPSPACGGAGSRPQPFCFSGPVSITVQPSSRLRENFPVPHRHWRPGAGVSSPAAATG